MQEGIGKAVRRKEDLRLLTGRGRYSDDYNFPGQAYSAVHRAPHAHALIRGIDTTAARAVPGVIAVLTGEDARADGLNNIPHLAAPGTAPDIVLHNRDGSPVPVAPHYMLPTDRVRHVGTGIAFVIAESIAAAKDAAEKIVVEYEPLPVVIDAKDAVAPGAPQLYDDIPNVLIDAEVGDAKAVAEAFANAAYVTRLDTWINRVTGVPMEPRSAVGIYDKDTGRYTLYAGSGGIVRQKRELARILGVEQDVVRVIAHEIGGNFGTKNSFFPEFAMVAWGSRRIGRPVKWTAERHEAMITDYMGRDLTVSAELALDADGRFLALRTSNLSNVGSYSGSYVPLVKGVGLVTAGYRIPVSHIHARAVLSTTMSTTPYRSAGRPEVIYVIERLIDKAALEHGFDRVALRRRNLIPPSAFPYKNPQGITYDNGTYRELMERAMDLGDWKGFKKRRAEARKRNKLRGIGLCCYLETTGGYPRERADITVHPQGRVDVVVGTLSSGQSHETTFAQCVAEWLGVPFDDVHVFEADTDIVKEGGGSHSARSMRLAGIVMGKASDAIIEKARKIAAHMLETDADDIAFADGRFAIKGTDRSVGIFDVAATAAEGKNLPEDLAGTLDATCDETTLQLGFPYGAHVCEVEIDRDTGALKLVSYTAIDDVGRAVNPMVVDGQTHGGAAQGIGQALWELCAYDEQGQYLSGSFMDYVMPRADLLPSFITDISEVLTPTNRLGVRGAGEGGTTGALGAVVNAVVDALAEFGVTHMDMPTTPEKIWRAMQSAKSSNGKAQGE
ncbi:MAG TPA: xanthine dehydrogenase family protein molybdopterin-binding subunit [Xanthobacteraceae bacterium]|jgi:carbon-monoxide dehydrogenase large subunit|nr:xanthine dehydrogenase family protein molybdopterin-binding subunit [Xanthobacteraceae bacterium]